MTTSKLPTISPEFIEPYSTYISSSDYTEIKKAVVKNTLYDYNFEGEYVIRISTKDTTFTVSFFSHKNNEILVEFNRRAGCGLTYVNIKNSIVKQLESMFSMKLYVDFKFDVNTYDNTYTTPLPIIYKD